MSGVNIAGAVRQLRWYLREVSGESAYDRYLEAHRSTHPGVPALSRREFERRRMDDRDGRPQSRCC